MPPQRKHLAYLFLVLTNLYGLRMGRARPDDSLLWVLAPLAVLASAVMHAEEGSRFLADPPESVEAFRQRAWKLIVADRIAAGALVVYILFFYPEFFLRGLVWRLVLPGIFCILSSEPKAVHADPIVFALLHGTWHLLAFHLGYLAVCTPQL